MNHGDPPLHWDEADDPPPHDFPGLLQWLRETYCLRLYVAHGLPIPQALVNGYKQKMVGACLKRHGFRPGSQFQVSRMEKGETWPGKRNPDDKAAFLYAAAECYGIKGTYLESMLSLALLFESGKRGFRQPLIDNIFQRLHRPRGGPQ